MMTIGTSVLVMSIASQQYNQFKATGYGPVPDSVQYLGMMVTRDRNKHSIVVDQIGYIN